MKRTLTGLAAASILVALPLAASAHDNDGYRGWNGYEQRGAQYYPVKPKHYYKHYQPPVVYYPPPRFVQPRGTRSTCTFRKTTAARPARVTSRGRKRSTHSPRRATTAG